MITRRHFLAGSAVALGVTALADDAALSIIDAHFHVWDRERRLVMPWLHNAEELLNRDYTPADYEKAIGGLNVRGSIYVEVAVEPEAREYEMTGAVKLCKQKQPAVLGVVAGGDPTDKHFAGYVDWLQTMSAIRGMRVTLPEKPATIPLVVKGIQRLGKLRITVDLNAGGAQLVDRVDLIKACEETSFIIDHCGNASPSWFDNQSTQPNVVQWRDTMKQLAACPNAACKISGVAENGPPAKPESVRMVAGNCLDLFGPDRVLFATNWPVCLKATTPAKWFSIVDQLTRRSSLVDRQKLFAQNVERWYRLA